MALGFMCTFLASCLLSQPLCAESGPGNLAITKAWSRATPGGAKVAGAKVAGYGHRLSLLL
jgi:hypothetical protein